MTHKSKQLPLSRFSSTGLSDFKRLLGRASSMSAMDVEEKLFGILGSKSASRVVAKDVSVPIFTELDTRHDTAVKTQELLTAAGIKATMQSGHDTLFAWLAAAFLPSLCGRTSSDSLKVGATHRYVLSRSSSEMYRHLVACPYWLLETHGKTSRIFLSQNASIMPDVVEQIVSRPWLIDSKGVVEVIDRLYWDDAKKAPKPKYTSTTPAEGEPLPGYAKKPPIPGSLRALESVLGQLQCTYDLRSMNSDDILDKLPPEFNSWLKS